MNVVTQIDNGELPKKTLVFESYPVVISRS